MSPSDPATTVWPPSSARLLRPTTPVTIDARFVDGALQPRVLLEVGPPPSEPSPSFAARAASPADRMPLGYVLLSTVFLMIALAGFGVWLVFAVISL